LCTSDALLSVDLGRGIESVLVNLVIGILHIHALRDHLARRETSKVLIKYGGEVEGETKKERQKEKQKQTEKEKEKEKEKEMEKDLLRAVKDHGGNIGNESGGEGDPRHLMAVYPLWITRTTQIIRGKPSKKRHGGEEKWRWKRKGRGAASTSYH